MPLQILQVEPGCDDPVGLLTACHRRIERFLSVLATIAQRSSGDKLDAAEGEMFGRALRYFREAAPKHTADEEQDLFPALSRSHPSLRAVLERLESDHACASELHDRVDRIGGDWLRSGALDPVALGELRDALAGLQELYAGHIQAEEQELFPAASQVLNEAELETIGRSMAERRGIPWPVGRPNRQA